MATHLGLSMEYLRVHWMGDLKVRLKEQRLVFRWETLMDYYCDTQLECRWVPWMAR